MSDEFKLKNYTSKVPACQTIMEIERLLVSFGASQIAKDLAGDSVRALGFRIGTHTYRLPANVNGVYRAINGDKMGHSSLETMERAKAQAERSAWRIIRDWLHSQLSLIKSNQAEAEEVLLPYLCDGHRSFFQVWKEKEQLKLTAGSGVKS